jgi:diguanylate cyclase (GGDEF)-like protein
VTRLDRVRARLGGRFVDNLRGYADGLELALDELRGGNAEASQTLRRLAHQLRGSGAAYGYPNISTAAKDTELATEEELAGTTRTLIEELHAARTGAQPQKAHILHVEDDADMAAMLRTTRPFIEADVTTVPDLSSARERLARQSFDVVIVDLGLPDGDGRDLIAELRTSRAHADAVVGVVTVDDSAISRAESRALGADFYVLKSQSVDEMGHIVEGFVATARSASLTSTLDPLTGLPDRAGLERAWARMRHAAERATIPLAVALLDVDRFKLVNDRFGHAVGDEVLRGAAIALKEGLRRTDVPARWGGDELAVLLPGADAHAAAEILSRLGEKLRDREFEGAPDLSVTFSGGVVDAREHSDLEAAIAAADRLLYAAKQTGRRQILSSLPPEYGSAGARVLAVDDDPMVRAEVREILESAGHLVVTASDGREALQIAKSTHFDLCVLDVEMPHVDGHSLVRALRRPPIAFEGPVLMLTARDDVEAEELSFEAGADDHLIKPVRPRPLLARVRRALERSGLKA